MPETGIKRDGGYHASTGMKESTLPTMSTDTEWAEAVRDIQRTLGELELADAREALRDIGHPAGSRHGPVWCATHVRAILEDAWSWMKQYEKESPGPALQCIAPGTVARWLEERDQWIALHQLGERIAVEAAARAGLEQPWREWLTRQTPIAHYTHPGRNVELAGAGQNELGRGRTMKLKPIQAFRHEQEQERALLVLCQEISAELEQRRIRMR